MDHVRRVLNDRQLIEGLSELRAGLLIDIDSEVLDQIERGEWWLVRAEADYGDWPIAEQAFDCKVMELKNNPPPQPSRTPRIFRLIDSVTGEPLVQRSYIATVDGETVQRTTDGEGIAHLFMPTEVQQVSMMVRGY